MTSHSSAGRRPGVLFQVSGSLLVAVLSAASWAAWLGWDNRYQVDPRTGVSSGPYEAWQVAGCALSLVVVLVATLRAGMAPLPAGVALTVAFTAVWTMNVAAHDDSGMYAVGTVMPLLGLGTATALVSLLTRPWWIREQSGPRPSLPCCDLRGRCPKRTSVNLSLRKPMPDPRRRGRASAFSYWDMGRARGARVVVVVAVR